MISKLVEDVTPVLHPPQGPSRFSGAVLSILFVATWHNSGKAAMISSSRQPTGVVIVQRWGSFHFTTQQDNERVLKQRVISSTSVSFSL